VLWRIFTQQNPLDQYFFIGMTTLSFFMTTFQQLRSVQYPDNAVSDMANVLTTVSLQPQKCIRRAYSRCQEISLGKSLREVAVPIMVAPVAPLGSTRGEDTLPNN
jgi:hypothetical protein